MRHAPPYNIEDHKEDEEVGEDDRTRDKQCCKSPYRSSRYDHVLMSEEPESPISEVHYRSDDNESHDPTA